MQSWRFRGEQLAGSALLPPLSFFPFSLIWYFASPFFLSPNPLSSFLVTPSLFPVLSFSTLPYRLVMSPFLSLLHLLLSLLCSISSLLPFLISSFFHFLFVFSPLLSFIPWHARHVFNYEGLDYILKMRHWRANSYLLPKWNLSASCSQCCKVSPTYRFCLRTLRSGSSTLVLAGVCLRSAGSGFLWCTYFSPHTQKDVFIPVTDDTFGVAWIVLLI